MLSSCSTSLPMELISFRNVSHAWQGTLIKEINWLLSHSRDGKDPHEQCNDGGGEDGILDRNDKEGLNHDEATILDSSWTGDNTRHVLKHPGHYDKHGLGATNTMSATGIASSDTNDVLMKNVILLIQKQWRTKEEPDQSLLKKSRLVIRHGISILDSMMSRKEEENKRKEYNNIWRSLSEVDPIIVVLFPLLLMKSKIRLMIRVRVPILTLFILNHDLKKLVKVKENKIELKHLIRSNPKSHQKRMKEIGMNRRSRRHLKSL